MTIVSFRIMVISAATLLIALSFAEYQAWREAVDQALRTLTEMELSTGSPRLRDDLASERDPVRTRLRLARALLADELDVARLARTPLDARESVRARGVKRLQAVEDLAVEALSRRPSSWQAAMLLGGARHLRLLRGRDARLATEENSWRVPLDLARRLAPSHAEPTRLLAAVELGNWSRMSHDRRQGTVDLLETAFEDNTSFELLIERWLVVAPSFNTALSIVPPRPRPWDRIRRIYASRRDWDRYVRAHGHYKDALFEDLDRRLDEARIQITSGKEMVGSAQLKRVARDLPRERRFLHLLDRFVELLENTPRPLHPRGETLSRWLDWLIDQCLLEECPRSPTTMARLVTLGGDLRFDQVAAVALLAEDWDLARLYESRAESTADSSWAPYKLLQARRLTDAGDLNGARVALDAVHLDWRETPLYALARLSLASAARDEQRQAEWQRRVARLQQPLRPGSEWTRSDDTWRLVFLSRLDSSGLEIAIDGARPAGSPVAVTLDGEVIGWFPVFKSDILDLDIEITEGVHRLELSPLLDHSLVPGPIRLGEANPT
jgi:hypothetical protein